VNQEEYKMSEDSLKWAARTYTAAAAAIVSLATLLYFLSIYLGRDQLKKNHSFKTKH